jgi:uncharacterized glyoxalase superfamily protein PhnB
LWNDDLVYHFREEEEVLLPILSRYGAVTDDPDVRAMLEDHARLRDGLRRLQILLEAGEEHSDLARDLGSALETHVRLEDRIIFGRLEQSLSDSDLEEIGRLSREHRERWHRPIGPEKGGSRKVGDRPLAHYVLFVADQAASRDFYSIVLGIEPRLDVPGMTELELSRGVVLGLMPRKSIKTLLGVESGHHSSELYLVVSDPKAAMERAVSQGASILSPPQKRDWGATVVYLEDLDGHILALADGEATN